MFGSGFARLGIRHEGFKNEGFERLGVEIIKTRDGSDTVFRDDLNEPYHSIFGAITESQYIFIDTGLRKALERFKSYELRVTSHDFSPGPYPASCIQHPTSNILHPVSPGNSLNILEIGFGTGLNALLAQVEAEKRGIKLCYTTLEAYPLREEVWSQLNYPQQLCSAGYFPVFAKLHQCDWNSTEWISTHFSLHKILGEVQDFIPEPGQYQLVFFDAFGPEVQPELWTEKIFRIIFEGLAEGGILVTYSVKGTVVRALQAAGFITEKLPGPPGKRHILRATKKHPGPE